VCERRKGKTMSGKFRGFLHRNLVTLVTVPALVLIHWGWYKLQDVEVLVTKDEKKELPIIIVSF
jgi:hypothetical protein